MENIKKIINVPDKRAVLWMYDGDNPRLERGVKYSRTDIAKAFSRSLPFVSGRLKGKKICQDIDLIIHKKKKSEVEQKSKTFNSDLSQHWLRKKLR